MVTLVTGTFLLSPSCNLKVDSHLSDPLLKIDIPLLSHLMAFPLPFTPFPCKPEMAST